MSETIYDQIIDWLKANGVKTTEKVLKDVKDFTTKYFPLVACDNPNCDKLVELSQPHAIVKYNHKTFHFCCDKCKEEYIA